MVASATSRVAQAGDQIKGAQNALAASEQQIDAAKKVHLKMYTKDLSTAKQREVLARAKANLEAAEKAIGASEGSKGLIGSSVVIPSPHMDMVKALL
jgi:hypothetical protein